AATCSNLAMSSKWGGSFVELGELFIGEVQRSGREELIELRQGSGRCNWCGDLAACVRPGQCHRRGVGSVFSSDRIQNIKESQALRGAVTSDRPAAGTPFGISCGPVFAR